ncbi:MAG: hypothetical protein AB7H97_17660 [Pseudobdellovibrionaceae bacterium]
MRLSIDWLDQILTKPADESWKDIFTHLNALASAQESEIKTRYRSLETEVAHIDHMLSSSAWDLWEQFSSAPKGSAFVKEFWSSTVGPKAVLILDSLSIREVGPICEGLKKLGLSTNVHFAGSEAPSETEIYANALGVNGRFELAKKPVPAKFFVPNGDAYVDTFKNIPFDESVKKLPADKNLFIWHGWPDDSLHVFGKFDDAFNRFIDHVNEQVDSDGFKTLVSFLARGRELLITSDHGYCDTSGFQMAQNDEHKELKTLGHTRAKSIKEEERFAGRTIPPATLEMYSTSSGDLYRIAVGRRRPSDKGFPALTHGGLSLMECTVPLIRVQGAARG